MVKTATGQAEEISSDLNLRCISLEVVPEFDPEELLKVSTEALERDCISSSRKEQESPEISSHNEDKLTISILKSHVQTRVLFQMISKEMTWLWEKLKL